MPLPIRNDLLNMSFSSYGELFVEVTSKSDIDTNGMEWSYNVSPFWSNYMFEYLIDNFSKEDYTPWDTRLWDTSVS